MEQNISLASPRRLRNLIAAAEDAVISGRQLISRYAKEANMQYPVIDLKATGERIRELRKQHNLKVEEIADYMGFESVQAVYKWQRGDSLPSVDNLFALSKLFETSMEDILRSGREGDESPLLPFYRYLTTSLL